MALVHLKLTYLSSVAAKMYFPLGENLTYDTGGFSSSELERCIEINN